MPDHRLVWLGSIYNRPRYVNSIILFSPNFAKHCMRNISVPSVEAIGLTLHKHNVRKLIWRLNHISHGVMDKPHYIGRARELCSQVICLKTKLLHAIKLFGQWIQSWKESKSWLWQKHYLRNASCLFSVFRILCYVDKVVLLLND